jgi:hypothetical protein
MKLPFLRLLLLCAVLLSGVGPARAEMVTFSYSWDVQPSTVLQGLPGSTGSVQVTPVSPGTTPQFPLGPPPGGGTAIQGAFVSTNSSATSAAPDHFDSDFHMVLTLTDSASNQSGQLTFTGHLAGTLATNFTTSELNATFSNDATQQLTLGSHEYTVTMDPTLLPLPLPNASSVLLGALVNVTNVEGGSGSPGGHVPQPEPSSLILGATAVAGLALRRLMRSRAQQTGA